MGRAALLLLTSLGAAVVSGRVHVERALVTDAEGPNGQCPAPTITTIIAAQGVYYSQTFESASQILNFYGNETITVQNAPTTIVQNTYITTTIIQTTGGSTTSGSPSTITGATSTVLTLAHNNAQATVYTTVTTGSDGQTTTVTSALPSLTLGEGIPAGTSVTSIPTQSSIILAIGPAGGGAKFKRDEPDIVRRQATTSPTATAASFAQNDGGSTGNNCGFATRYTLSNGMLQSGNDTVGKDLFALYAPLIPSDQVSQVNITFFFNNGLLSWSTTDVGPAIFYQCDSGPIYAAFENSTPPGTNCQPAMIGGVAAAACPVDYTQPSSTSVATSIQTVQSTVDVTPSSAPTTTSSPEVPPPSSSVIPPVSSSGVPLESSSPPTSTSSNAGLPPASSSPPTSTSSNAGLPPASSSAVAPPGSSSLVAPPASSNAAPPPASSSASPVPASSSAAPPPAGSSTPAVPSLASSTPAISSSAAKSTSSSAASAGMTSSSVSGGAVGGSSVVLISLPSIGLSAISSSTVVPAGPTTSSAILSAGTLSTSSTSTTSPRASSFSTSLLSSSLSSSASSSSSLSSPGASSATSTSAIAIFTTISTISLNSATSTISTMISSSSSSPSSGISLVISSSSSISTSSSILPPSSASSSATAGTYSPGSSTTGSTSTGTTTSSAAPSFTSFCPAFDGMNRTVGGYNYEIECGKNVAGSNIASPYAGADGSSYYKCFGLCNYWNTNNATGANPTPCVGITFQISTSTCYLYGAIGNPPYTYNANFEGGRLLYSGYPSITDNPTTAPLTASTTILSISISSSNAIAFTSSSPTMVSSTLSLSSIFSTVASSSTVAGSTSSSVTSTPSSLSTSTSFSSPLTTSVSAVSPTAPTWYNAATYTVTNTAASALCSGYNIPQPPAMPPLAGLNTGAYDYQKAQVGGFNYEIECHTAVGSGTSTTGISVTYMEQCVQQCSNANALVANSCLSIQWDSLLHGCVMYSGASAEPLFIATVRSARLLTSSSNPPYPLIDDQQYLLPNQSAYNIGICTGPGASSYAGTRINVQGTNGLYQTTNAQIWNECGGLYYPGSGTLSVAGVIAGLNAAQSQYVYTTPASSDDCLRLCFYTNISPSGYTGPTNCRGYQWDNTNTCTLATGAGTTVTYLSSIVAAGRWQGSGFLPTDTPAGYKLRARQTGGLRQF